MMQGRNIDCSIDLAIHALTLTPQQLGPRMLVAGGLYAKGQLREAESRFSEVVRDAFEQQYTIVLSACITGLACTIMKQGRLNEAVNVIESNIDALHENGWYEMLHDRSCLYLALGEIAYKRNELIAAQKYFKKVKEETRIGPFEELERIADIYLAMIDWNQGDKTAAAKALEEYTNLVVLPAPLPLFQSYSLVLARAAMLMNNSKPAIDYIASRNISETYEPHPERESDDILLIRVLLKNRDTEKSLQLISSLMDNAEQEHRVEALLELWVLQVVALQQLGDQKRAVESLQHALKLAEVENCVRIFINEHVPVRKLLEYVVKNCNDTTYARKLLELMPGDDEDLEDNPEKRHSCATILSNTELRILCLLTMGLSNKEIAEKSFISNNTVKTHLRNIYQKLGVNNRAKAIVRAKELGIERRAGHAE
jgi:LuxR family maltose regulon positive regulatory protein